MAKCLAKLFDRGGDEPLCDRLFVRLCEVHGNGADVRTLSDAERVVYCVWGAVGVIGNGGFRYLFESDLPGDPHFTVTRDCFEAIGCWEASAAFGQAFAAFADGRPPADPGERVRLYLRRHRAFLAEPDRAFHAAEQAVVRNLANWVRTRQRSFAQLM